jgi:hypothetical protein
MWECRLVLFGSDKGEETSCSKHGNEALGSMKANKKENHYNIVSLMSFDAVQDGDAMKVYPVLCNNIIPMTDKYCGCTGLLGFTERCTVLA